MVFNYFEIGVDMSSLSSGLTNESGSSVDADIPSDVSTILVNSKVGKNTLLISEAPKRPEAAVQLNPAMIDLIDICMKEDLDEIVLGLFNDKDKYILFMKTVLVGVIRKKKWNEMFSVHCNKYYKYITPSDEAFGILTLDNNGDRLICTALNMKDKDKLCIPKYTNVHGEKRMRRNNERGWSKIGQKKYWELEDKIITWRKDNLEKMEEYHKEILKLHGIVDSQNDMLEQQEEILKRKLEAEEEAKDICLQMFKKKMMVAV